MPQQYCRSCGAQLKPGAAFCQSCGAPLSAPAAPVEVPTPVESAQPRPPHTATRRKVNNKLIAVIAVACVVIAAVAVAVVLNLGGRDAGEETDVSEKTAASDKADTDEDTTATFSQEEEPADVAASIHLEEIEGTVSLTNNKGIELSVLPGMQLFDGNAVGTETESFAYLSLDRLRAAKLDMNSAADIAQNGGDTELYLREGKLFFNIQRPLEDDETLNIRTSTMVIGIRGTSGVVRAGGEDTAPGMYVLDGEVTLTAGTQTLTVRAGEIAELVEAGSGVSEFRIRPLKSWEIDAFAIAELTRDADLQERIDQDSDLDTATILASTEWRAAYYSVLSDLVNEYGMITKSIVDDLNNNSVGTDERYVGYAELLDFDNDGTPELTVIHSDGGYFGVYYNVYRFDSITKKAVKVTDDIYMGESRTSAGSIGILIFTGVDGRHYHNFFGSYYDATGDYRIAESNYATIIDGRWGVALEAITRFDDTTYEPTGYYAINGEVVSEEEYNIEVGKFTVSIKDISPNDWEGHKSDFGADVVNAVLRELKPSARIVETPEVSVTPAEPGIITFAGYVISTDVKEISEELSHMNISDLSPLKNLTNLEVLYLWDNQISDLSPLENSKNLKSLFLERNLIRDLSPLSGLANLTSLTLATNQISDLSPLEGLTNLEDLNICENQISDLSPLKGLTNLKRLELGGNQIGDLSPLKGLTNLKSLNIGSMRENQISQQQVDELRQVLPNCIIDFYN